MTSPESNNPLFYDEIFAGFVGLAASRGTINYDPLEPAMEPGNDGTLTPEGERAFCYMYEIGPDKMPKPIRDAGIDMVTIHSYTSQIYDGEIWPERIAIDLHEPVGMTRHFSFQKEADIIIANDVVVADDNERDQKSAQDLVTK